MAGVIHGLSEWCIFTNFEGKKRSIASTSCDVKDDVNSFTVAVGLRPLNQSWDEAYLPQALMLDRGKRRTLIDFERVGIVFVSLEWETR